VSLSFYQNSDYHFPLAVFVYLVVLTLDLREVFL
jgi:hypothetical protein